MDLINLGSSYIQYNRYKKVVSGHNMFKKRENYECTNNIIANHSVQSQKEIFVDDMAWSENKLDIRAPVNTILDKLSYFNHDTSRKILKKVWTKVGGRGVERSGREGQIPFFDIVLTSMI